MTSTYIHEQPFILESGEVLHNLRIQYTTHGTLNEESNNVVWICHAFSANSNPAEWWSGLVGEGRLFDTAHHYIVCANMIGSCYGSSSPEDINPSTGQRYASSFPLITIRDIAKAHSILREHLGIQQIAVCIGGSMGAQQVLEWSVIEPTIIERAVVISAGAVQSSWARGLNSAQRLALLADNTLWDESELSGKGRLGIIAARAIAMLSYRSYEGYAYSQADEDNQIEKYKVDSYLRYQGEKLANRFTAPSYWSLTRTMDSHDVGRNRGGAIQALKHIAAQTLIIGVSSDILFPPSEQKFLAQHIPNAVYHEIDSPYGHDGFLIEFDKLSRILTEFLEDSSLVAYTAETDSIEYVTTSY
jgi:homoserine O-acetyltransferase/O-succinyltransferase